MKKRWIKISLLLNRTLRFGISAFLLCLNAQSNEPVRIVTLAPSVAEIAATILGPQLTDSRIVGVSEFTDYPVSLKSKTVVGPYHHPNMELVFALRPDLVLVTHDGNPKSTADQMRTHGVKFVEVSSDHLAQIYESIQKIGDALERGGQANSIVSDMKKKVEKVRARASQSHSRESVLIQLEDQPLTVVGGGGFLNEALEIVGAQNVYADLQQSYPRVSVEDVLKRNPKWILCLAFSTAKPEIFVRACDRWKKHPSLDAVKNNRVQVVQADALMRPGPRFIEGLEFLQGVLVGKK